MTLPNPLSEPYYIENGLRRVRPYDFTYNTYCKERWRGEQLLNIYAREFRDRPVEYYETSIKSGKILINGNKVSTQYIVRNGDLISHTIHRHEPPVAAKPIGIVFEDNKILAIDKPAGVPVHPAGRYNYNSITQILRDERGDTWNPMPCNRLDRLTSGLMFFGKTAAAAEEMSQQIRQRTVKKEYIARVLGEFPEGDVTCEQPILQISPKLGLNRVRASGKTAYTVFKRLAYYPSLSKDEPGSGQVADWRNTESGMKWKNLTGYSIVSCRPLTGRTHQIRVHLQYLGHPISNDPIYCNQRVFGSMLGKGEDNSDNDEDIITRLGRMGKDEVADAVAYHEELVDEYNKRKAEKMTGEVCKKCETMLYSDPGVHELGIYLHAKKYACEGGKWEYETSLPEWALPPSRPKESTCSNKEAEPLFSNESQLTLDIGLDEK